MINTPLYYNFYNSGASVPIEVGNLSMREYLVMASAYVRSTDWQGGTEYTRIPHLYRAFCLQFFQKAVEMIDQPEYNIKAKLSLIYL